jgi:hypothetical protein
MSDVELLIQNIKGVFADLDDGGLTETEALSQIRDLVEQKEIEQEAQRT